MKIDKHTIHSISWVDLAATDLEAALAFYSDLMGWTTFEAPGTDYHMLMNNGEPVGGAMALTEEMKGMPQTWSTYVAVEDAAAACEAAKNHGGMVFQEPFDIPDGDKIAVVGDPAGAAICVFEGSLDNGMKQLDEPGAPCWFDCFSRDAGASNEFYSAVFGWSVDKMDGPMDYYTYTHDGAAIAGCMAMDDSFPSEVPAHWRVSFSIEGPADEWAAKAEAKGAQVTQPPTDTPYGRMFSILDPWGAPIGLMDRSTATEG